MGEAPAKPYQTARTMILSSASRVPILTAAGVTLAVGALLSGVVHAQERNAGAPATIVVTRGDCAALVEHTPAANVEYRPGVDVRGRSVVAAEVSGASRIAAPDEIAIDGTVQVFQFLKRTPPHGLGDTSTNVGRLVFADGKLSFNGEPLSDPATHAIAEACSEKLGR